MAQLPRCSGLPPPEGGVKGRLRRQQGDTVPEAGSLLPCTCFRQEKGKNTARGEKPTCQKQRKKELRGFGVTGLQWLCLACLLFPALVKSKSVPLFYRPVATGEDVALCGTELALQVLSESLWKKQPQVYLCRKR